MHTATRKETRVHRDGENIEEKKTNRNAVILRPKVTNQFSKRFHRPERFLRCGVYDMYEDGRNKKRENTRA